MPGGPGPYGTSGRVSTRLLTVVSLGVAAFGFALWAVAATLTEPFTTAANYVYDAAKILVSGGTATLKSPTTVASDDTQAEFDAGTHTHTSFQTTKVTLAADNPLVSTTSLIAAWPLDESSGRTAAESLETHNATLTSIAGLVSHWKMDEGTGTIAGDNTGLNAGTLSGATWSTSGKYGKALSFDGVDDYVSVPAAAALDPGSGNQTIAAWIKTSSATDQAITYKETSGAPSNQVNFRVLADGKLRLNVSDGTTNGWVDTSTATVANGTWRHVAAVWTNGGTVQFYVDGTAASATVGSALPTGAVTTTGSLYIGSRIDDAASFRFNGLIDDVQIYNVALTAAQV
ncbi:MAG: LamG domain-containing protein, partial [Candidatus Omnitrophica bacterium]|nr:LamG domain-containing protein [Candidatus Omnitrophota bacterium]